LTPSAVATALGALVLVLLAADSALADLAHQLTLNQFMVGCTLVLAFAGVGVVVARRQPRNPIGWILIGLVALLGLRDAAGFYAVLHYRLGHAGLPFAPAAVVLTNTAWLPALALPPLVIVLFPDGRLAPRRWRRVLWAYAGLIAGATLVVAAQPIAAVAGHDIRVDSSGVLTNTDDLTGWLAHPPVWLVAVILVSIAGIWLSFLGHQALSWRRAAGEHRQQLKWLACGAAVTVAWLIAMLVFNLPVVGAAALPVSIGIAILKYRLYDIDRIISRTLAYAIVTGLLVGLYAGLVLLATQVVLIKTPVAVAASTLAAAALFNPLRRRVQRMVDRRFNRARYDADAAVAGFAARLKDAVDPDAARTELLDVVHRSLEPAHASVWIRQHD
jgi:hypothetical protein